MKWGKEWEVLRQALSAQHVPQKCLHYCHHRLESWLHFQIIGEHPAQQDHQPLVLRKLLQIQKMFNMVIAQPLGSVFTGWQNSKRLVESRGFPTSCFLAMNYFFT